MSKSTRSKAVLALIESDEWRLAEADTALGPGMVRFRVPVLSGKTQSGYGRVLRVVWGYAEESSGAMPSDEDSARMEAFEEHLCQAVEHDAQAVLTAVLTFDGARQWVFYTDDAKAFLTRLQQMPQEAEPSPARDGRRG